MPLVQERTGTTQLLPATPWRCLCLRSYLHKIRSRAPDSGQKMWKPHFCVLTEEGLYMKPYFDDYGDVLPNRLEADCWRGSESSGRCQTPVWDGWGCAPPGKAYTQRFTHRASGHSWLFTARPLEAAGTGTLRCAASGQGSRLGWQRSGVLWHFLRWKWVFFPSVTLERDRSWEGK